jgi:hypothetical protein
MKIIIIAALEEAIVLRKALDTLNEKATIKK